MRSPSASTLTIFLACPYSARDGLELMPDAPGEPALTGSTTHSLIDAHVRGAEPAYEAGGNVERAQRLFASWRAWWPNFAGELAWSH